ncbi:hypothetical protein Lser_V15G14511 [Lactuca serriola]
MLIFNICILVLCHLHASAFKTAHLAVKPPLLKRNDMS